MRLIDKLLINNKYFKYFNLCNAEFFFRYHKELKRNDHSTMYIIWGIQIPFFVSHLSFFQLKIFPTTLSYISFYPDIISNLKFILFIYKIDLIYHKQLNQILYINTYIYISLIKLYRIHMKLWENLNHRIFLF